MPTLPDRVERRVDRFRTQRWVLDNVIRTVGVTWGQGDMDFALFPCGIGALGDFLRVEHAVRKYNDIAREYAAAAKRRQAAAEAADEAGYPVLARESYYIASVLYGQAQWPIAEHTRQNLDLEARKNRCYARYAELADHIVRPAEIPYQGKSLPGYLHLPPTYTPGQKLPVVITVGGMDSTKEICVALHGDQLLQRGIAVFLFDGPGQYSSALREIFITEDGFYEAGRAIHAWLAEQPEIDTEQIAVRGVSMGALWATQISTVIPTTKACAIAYPSYEQGEDTAFEMHSPSFKLRFMFMAGYQDEAEFDKFIPRINPDGLAEKVTCPYLVCAGEDDEWSSIESTFAVLNDIPTPKQLLLYQAEGHVLHSRGSSHLGPNEFAYMADWISDRFQGKPMDSQLSIVDAAGRVHHQPWGEHQTYEYGLPDLG